MLLDRTWLVGKARKGRYHYFFPLVPPAVGVWPVGNNYLWRLNPSTAVVREPRDTNGFGFHESGPSLTTALSVVKTQRPKRWQVHEGVHKTG